MAVLAFAILLALPLVAESALATNGGIAPLTTSLPGARSGQTYFVALKAKGGVRPYRCNHLNLHVGTLALNAMCQITGRAPVVTSRVVTGPFIFTLRDSGKPPKTIQFSPMKLTVRANSIPPTTTTTSTTTTTTPTPAPTSGYYLSLGDSYAAGFLGTGGNNGGYATKIVTDVAPNHELTLKNFACSGASTTSMITVNGCPAGSEAPGGVAYPNTTQLAAAIDFIEAHPGQIALITITIGGNDLLQGAAWTAIAANIANIAFQLRTAAGSSVPMIGLNYPDTVLADWLSGPSGETLAEESVTHFQQTINPAWKAAYAASNGAFVDIDAASGGYTPLTQLVNDPPYGEIPYAVAQVCILTAMCSASNVHPTDAGYTLIAQQTVLAYLSYLS